MGLQAFNLVPCYGSQKLIGAAREQFGLATQELLGKETR
jgi:hypothetical protein